MKIGLVLEGGGFRGVFVEGVTSWMLDNNIHMPYVVGVSMGAINATNYIAKQARRNLEVLEEFINDPRYISKRNIIKNGGLFNMDFIFNDIANIHHPFDFKTFETNQSELVIGAMNCHEGKTDYFYKSKEHMPLLMKALEASASLPFVSKKVKVNHHYYLDGGITDPIPIEQAFKDGCDKVIVVLTRHENYIKKAFKGKKMSHMVYKNYPKVTQSLSLRHHVYTQTQHQLKLLEQEGKVIIIRPQDPLEVSRTEKNYKKVLKAYEAGYDQAEKNKNRIIDFLKGGHDDNK